MQEIKEIRQQDQQKLLANIIHMAMKSTTGYPICCWWQDDFLNSVIELGVSMGWLYRRSTTQVHWTEEAAEIFPLLTSGPHKSNLIPSLNLVELLMARARSNENGDLIFHKGTNAFQILDGLRTNLKSLTNGTCTTNKQTSHPTEVAHDYEYSSE